MPKKGGVGLSTRVKKRSTSAASTSTKNNDISKMKKKKKKKKHSGNLNNGSGRERGSDSDSYNKKDKNKVNPKKTNEALVPDESHPLYLEINRMFITSFCTIFRNAEFKGKFKGVDFDRVRKLRCIRTSIIS